MAEFDKNLNPKNLREINKEASRLNEALSGVSVALANASKNAAKVTGETASSFKSSQSQANRLASKLQSLTADQLKDLKKNEEFKKDIVKLDAETAARTAKIATLQEDINALYDIGGKAALREVDALAGVMVQLQEQNSIAEEVKGQFKEIAETVEKMERANPFKGLSEVTKSIPIVGKIFSGMSGAAETFNKELAKSNDRMSALGKASKGVAKDLAKGFMVMVVDNAVEGFKRFDEATVTLEKNLNVSTLQAAKLQQKFIDIGQENIGLTATDLTSALNDANAALGTTADLSASTLTTFATLTKQLGFSADEAGNLNKFALATGQSFEDFTDSAIGTVKVLNAQNDTALDYKGILKDINQTSDAVKFSLEAQGFSLAKAAFEAKKMGLSLDQMDGIAGSLLDFEQSIANELEAELLLGKDLNLEKARQMALDGDLVGMAKEISKQGITANKFNKMNRIEQESIAKAMGMSRGEMATMFKDQSALNQLQVDGAANLDDAVNKKYDLIMSGEAEAKKAILESAATEEQKAKQLADLKTQTQNKLDKLVTDSGKKELVNKRKAQTLEEKIREDQIKVQDQLMKSFSPEAFTGMKDSMDSVSKSIPELTKAIKFLTIAIGVMQGLSFVKDSAKFLKNMKGGGGVIKNLNKGVKGLTSSLTNASGAAGGIASNLDSAASAAGAKGGGAIMKASGKKVYGAAATSAVKAGSASAMGGAAKSGGLFSRIIGGAKSIAGKAGGAISNVAGKVSNVAGKLNPKQAIGKFLKGPNIGKFIKKIPYLGALIGPAIETYMLAQAAGGGADPRMVGNQVVNAIGGLGGGILGSVLGSFVPVPGIGTFVGSVLGDMAGRYVAGLVSDNIDTSSLGQMAIKAFGNNEESGITPQMASTEGGGMEVAPDMASDFISRPGQPIQKFRPDDVVIGATNPMGGGNENNGRTVELLERLVTAVEKGGIINMDGNKVGTMLGMSSYRTQ